MTRDPRIVIIGAGVAGIADRGHTAAGGISRLHDSGEGRRRRRCVALEPLPGLDL